MLVQKGGSIYLGKTSGRASGAPQHGGQRGYFWQCLEFPQQPCLRVSQGCRCQHTMRGCANRLPDTGRINEGWHGALRGCIRLTFRFCNSPLHNRCFHQDFCEPGVITHATAFQPVHKVRLCSSSNWPGRSGTVEKRVQVRRYHFRVLHLSANISLRREITAFMSPGPQGKYRATASRVGSNKSIVTLTSRAHSLVWHRKGRGEI